MGKPGSGYMISAPGWPNIRIEKNMVGLPPGMMTIVSGLTSTPWRRAKSFATASRKGRMPWAGV